MRDGPIRLAALASSSSPVEATGDLGAIFQQHSGYVARISFRLLGRDSEVDDLVQDVFLEAMQGLQRLRDPRAIKGWLATVTVRLASRRLKLRRLRAWVGLESSLDPALTIDATQELGVFAVQVYRVLDSVPVQNRIAWVLRHVEGFSLEEVAEHCSCSLATAKRRIAAAHERLEEELGP